MKYSYAQVIVRTLLLVSIFVELGCFKPDVIIPAGHPAEGFVLGPEDVIEVVVWKTPELSRQVVIRPDGKISLALIGDVVASGLTADQLAEKIVEKYKAFKENPSVSVNVIEVNSYYVFIVGEVLKPGKLPLKSYTTVLQAMALAGGFTQFASRNNILVIRNVEDEYGKLNEIRIPLRYSDLISEDGGVYNLTLKSGDTVIVP
ncbi:polysaccharide biosynthesis/export family protein [Candidatus Nitrospira neomarina]|uniref:Polysaccharide biosynthesis/export family protein n=1 Tax=Candidatus Nitrospira neomarina TaxID=3020899 RepID=A0AA96JY20_9BACT|nr:polysaccharide biosynthesis/export family protein [Candidatus Nitrospira neomarina]WNM64033.1 polysaccharide biosynthesis/export family protein [Candidatus Nitrospira neomarina]